MEARIELLKINSAKYYYLIQELLLNILKTEILFYVDNGSFNMATDIIVISDNWYKKDF